MKTRAGKLLILFLLLSLPGVAKVKVVEKSAKKAPEWVNATRKDCIITSAIAPGLERAKEECFGQIKKTIINAVAQNVKASSGSTISQESVNNGIQNFLDTYTSSFQTQSAKVPYLSGISESKAEDAYWEKRLDTETKEVSYLYCVKYPFPSLELKKLVREFQRQDGEMNDKLQALKDLYGEVASVEQIDKSIADIEVLKHYFFDDVRQRDAQGVQQDYRRLYDQVVIREIGNQPGEYVFAFMLGERKISVSQRPSVKSETLTRLRTESKDGEWYVFYDYETCDPSEENGGKITFRIGGKPLVHSFFADVDQNEIKVFPTKEMYLTAKTKSDTTLSEITVRMNVEVHSRGLYLIKSLTLNVPGLETSLFIDNIKSPVKEGGTQSIQAVCHGTVGIREKQNFRKNVLKGYMEVADQKGNIRRVDFSLPFQANW